MIEKENTSLGDCSIQFIPGSQRGSDIGASRPTFSLTNYLDQLGRCFLTWLLLMGNYASYTFDCGTAKIKYHIALLGTESLKELIVEPRLEPRLAGSLKGTRECNPSITPI